MIVEKLTNFVRGRTEIDYGTHNDIVLRLEDGQLEASRPILSARSKYFRELFDRQRGPEVFIPGKKIIMKQVIQVYIQTHVF